MVIKFNDTKRDCAWYSAIREMDELIRSHPEEVSEDDIEVYRENIRFAKAAALKVAEVILCTCTTSGSRFLRSNINAQQVQAPLILAHRAWFSCTGLAYRL